MLTPRHVVAKIWSAAEVESQGPYGDQGVWGMAASWALSGGWLFPHPIFGQHVLWFPLLLFMMTHKRILTKRLCALEQGFVAQDIVPASGHIAEYGDISRRWQYLGWEELGKVSTDRWVGFWEVGGAGGGEHSGLRAQHTCMGTGRAWCVQAIQKDLLSPPGLIREQGLVSHPGRDFVLSVIPDPMQSNALHVILFHSLWLFLFMCSSYLS